mmetsp:Transcript_44928/g.118681  ORF Transcript_44928/g.118681 Transcript_44928/m.118681 type:complete len:396 (-) Transcript_44928:28-1215(-)
MVGLIHIQQQAPGNYHRATPFRQHVQDLGLGLVVHVSDDPLGRGPKIQKQDSRDGDRLHAVHVQPPEQLLVPSGPAVALQCLPEALHVQALRRRQGEFCRIFRLSIHSTFFDKLVLLGVQLPRGLSLRWRYRRPGLRHERILPLRRTAPLHILAPLVALGVPQHCSESLLHGPPLLRAECLEDSQHVSGSHIQLFQGRQSTPIHIKPLKESLQVPGKSDAVASGGKLGDGKPHVSVQVQASTPSPRHVAAVTLSEHCLELGQRGFSFPLLGGVDGAYLEVTVKFTDDFPLVAPRGIQETEVEICKKPFAAQIQGLEQVGVVPLVLLEPQSLQGLPESLQREGLRGPEGERAKSQPSSSMNLLAPAAESAPDVSQLRVQLLQVDVIRLRRLVQRLP